MIQSEVTFSINDILNYVQTPHLAILFLLVFVLTVIFSVAVLWHLNKYKDHSPLTILAELIFVIGIVIFISLAFTFLMLFSAK